MTGIKVLNVSYNQIVEIPKNTFPKLYELHTIDFSHNNLTQIFNAVFQTLFSLRSLNFSFNAMSELKSSTLGTLPTLLEMNLNDNQLKSIARGALTKLSSLRSLTVENNQLTRIFEIPISLNSLNLRNNQITEIPARTWPTMNSLLELDLRDNALENRLTGDSFTGLLTLRILKLNNNQISVIPRESFTVLSTLQYLHLEVSGGNQRQHTIFHIIIFTTICLSSLVFDFLLYLLNLYIIVYFHQDHCMSLIVCVQYFAENKKNVAIILNLFFFVLGFIHGLPFNRVITLRTFQLVHSENYQLCLN